ncbi:MAG: glycosyltransferase [Burkholderiaceae bacterium]|nr:glycosyltransferase [Burkholderiaceae bacterium]
MKPSLTDPAAVLDTPARRPKILLLTYISPLQRWGSAKRSRFLVDALKLHGTVDVLVLSFVDVADAEASLTVTDLDGVKVMDLQIVQRGLLSRPRFDLTSSDVSSQVAQHVDLAAYDLLVSRYVRPAMKLELPCGVPLIVDFDDAVYDPPWYALRTVKSWVGVLLRLFNDRIIVRTRLKGASWRHAHYLFCRDAEREVFGWLPGAVLPNLPPAADREGPPDFSPPEQPALMFVGLLDYMPNHDAVDWFLDAIWPIVLREVPEAHFLIVGSGADDRLERWRRHPSVETLGFVDSLADAYARATACVVPMRSGAGTNIKALEPYLYGRMVIATPLVVEGHHPLFRPGDDVLTAADPAGLARHCVAMLRTPQRASEIARCGYQRITTTLTEERFRKIVGEAVDSLLRTRG